MYGPIARVDVNTFIREFVPGSNIPEGSAVEAFHRDNLLGEEESICSEVLKVANSVLGHVQDCTRRPSIAVKYEQAWGYAFDASRTPYIIVGLNSEDVVQADIIEPSRPPSHTIRSNPIDQEEVRDEMGWYLVSLLIEVRSLGTDSPFVIPGLATAQPSRPVDESAPANTVPTSIPSLQPRFLDPLQTLHSSPSNVLSPSRTSSTNSSSRTESDLEYDYGTITMRQLKQHASEVMRRGSRLCVFTVFVCRDFAWLLRWDRAGVVVSDAFNLLEQPRVLPNFLYRFARMTDEQRGFDPTVTLASEEEAQLLHSIPQSGIETAWQKMAYADTRQKDWPVYTITIPEDDFIPPSRLTSDSTSIKAQDRSKPSRDGPLRKLVVGKAHFTSESITGRGTKCYLAYDITDRRAVFCKEYWRVDLPTSHAEGDVYVDLHQHGVEFIPTPIAAGDVRYGETSLFSTCTQEFLPDDSSQPRLILYRLLLKEIAEPLETYRNSRQLVSALVQCVLAHEQAWTKAKVLHRDISVNNILIYRYLVGGKIHWIAFLVDWAFCKYAHELGLAVVQQTRSGTWPFMSAVLLVFPGYFKHVVWHDLESFIHVLHWMCLRFHKTGLNDRDLWIRVWYLYTDAYRREDGMSCGGRAKLEAMLKGTIPFDLQGGSVGQPKGMHSLLVALSYLYGEHYAWLKAEGKLPTIDDAARPLEADAVQGASEDQDEVGGTPLDEFKFMEDAVSAPIVSEQPASNKPEPVLDHRRVKLAFGLALQGPGTWSDDPKSVTDRFALFDGFTLQSRSSVKRSSDGSSDRKGKRNSASKATASGTETPQT